MKSHERPSRTAELGRDLEDLVQAYMRSAGFEVVQGVRVRTWRPDIVAVRGDELVIVEVRGSRGELRKALAQTALYATDASSAYLAVPRNRIITSLKEAARVLGIGLMEVNDAVRVVVKPLSKSARPSLLHRVERRLERPTRPATQRIPRSTVPYDKILRHRSILESLFAQPRRRFTIRELSGAAHTSYATTWRIVEDLKALGAITSERVGPSEALSLVRDSALVADLRQLLSLSLAPHRLAAREFARRVAKLPGVDRIVLFGSVAQGRQSPGSDVDVAVVVRRETESMRGQVYDTVSKVQETTRMKVVPVFVTRRELESEGELGRALRAGEVLFERA